MKRNLRQDLYVYAATIALFIFILFPIYNMLCTSFKNNIDLWITSYLPQHFTLEPYYQVLTQTYWRVNLFWTWMWNSFRVAAEVLVMGVLIGSITGYAISSRCLLGKRVKDNLRTVTLITYIFPASLLSIPMFVLMMSYNLLNSDISLTLTFTALVTPFCAYMAAAYFNEIPREIEEAARVDGASSATIFLRILLPISVPMIIALSVYSFMYSWNNYLFPLLFMTDSTKFLMPVGMSSFLTAEDALYNLFMACGIVYSIPAVVVYFFFKKYLVSGLFRGAVKA